MTFRSIRRRAILAGAALAAMATTSAFAITDFTYPALKPGVLTIHHGSFAPLNDESAQDFSVNNAGSSLRGNGCYSRGLQLPIGAKFKALRTRALSNTTEGVRILIHAQQVFSHSEVFILDVKAGANAPGSTVNNLFLIPASVPAADANTAYSLTVCLMPGQTFNGARLEYTATNAGD